jgi:hypothetical protein
MNNSKVKEEVEMRKEEVIQDKQQCFPQRTELQGILLIIHFNLICSQIGDVIDITI